MSEITKYTPGPWSWKGENYDGDWGWQMLVGANGEGIIVKDTSLSSYYAQANARLIAAAPDLLESCKEAVVRITGLFEQYVAPTYCSNSNPSTDLEIILATLKEAIDKAEE